MALRMLEAHVAPEQVAEAVELLEAVPVQATWTEERGPLGAVVSAVVGAGSTGVAMDRLWEKLGSSGRLRVLVLPLQAVLPRPYASPGRESRQQPGSAAAVSREEVYAAVSSSAELDSTFLALTVLAATVAAVGLMANNTAAVIGAMVVAPLLGPNMGLALGLTLGDRALVREAIRSIAAGLMAAITTALALGVVFEIDPGAPELAARTSVGLGDMLLALAAGCAGTLAYATGVPSSLVGVMVAVALLPPLVAAGLFLGEGLYAQAGAAAVLTLANAVSVTLAAMLTFLAKGMRPRSWWEAAQARRTARLGLAALFALFALLAATLFAASRYLD
ncbi:MAG: TIGR00341 family protein [Myxococcota bacterium]|nr:TIGR00341 family protein [Myxococcota bacterium]